MKPKVVELHIPSDKLEYLNKIVLSKILSEKTKMNIIKKIACASACCVCRGIPSVKLLRAGEMKGAIEYYCDACLTRILERQKEEPSKQDLPNYYNCIKVDEIPHTTPTYY
jgi:hypothetical protein